METLLTNTASCLALSASGIFFMTGLLTGLWKYSHVGWASVFCLPTDFVSSAWANDRAVCPPYRAFMPHAALLQGDIINYTDIMPVIQISKVLVSS